MLMVLRCTIIKKKKTSPTKPWCVKVNNYTSKYGLQHGVFADNEQQDIKVSKINMVEHLVGK